MEFKFLKIVVFVPSSHADKVREALAKSGCGHVGDYDYCSFSAKGIGRFRPGEGTNPFIGEVPKKGEIGKIEQVEEDRIETICSSDKLKAVLEAVKKVHPYDEPAVDIYPLLNQGQL